MIARMTGVVRPRAPNDAEEARHRGCSGVARFGRVAWLVTGLALAAFDIFEVIVHELGAAPILVFAVLPDLPLIAGLTGRHRDGRASKLATRTYDLAHRPAVPIALIALALAGLLAARVLNNDPNQFEAARAVPLVAYVAGIAWLAHIAFDRTFGLSGRTRQGSD